MQANQVYQLLNSVMTSVYGSTAVQAQDLTGLIAMGDKVLSSSTDTDVFTNTLLDRIAKTVIAVRPYSPATKNILMDNFTWGAIVQKISVDVPSYSQNDSWTIQDGTNLAEVTAKLPTVKQKLFTDRNVWQIEFTIESYQLHTAFESETSVAAFISGLFTQVENAVSVAVEELANLCIANFMAEKINYQKATGATGVHAVNLLAQFNAETGGALTAATCLKDPAFLKYAGQQIRLHIKRMEKMSQIYNVDKYLRHTPAEDCNVFFLADYAASNSTYLESDTFHNELVALPGYSEVSYWQGQGLTGAFADTSKIDVTTSSGSTVSQTGIIGFICDRDALGINFNRRRSESQWFPKFEATQHYEKADMMFFNDLSENGIVFYVDDTTPAVAEVKAKRS